MYQNTHFQASYVLANSTFDLSFDRKFLSICLMLSVDSTVVMPSLSANSDDNVDFPHPVVPPNRNIIGIIFSRE